MHSQCIRHRDVRPGTHLEELSQMTLHQTVSWRTVLARSPDLTGVQKARTSWWRELRASLMRSPTVLRSIPSHPNERSTQ